MIHLRTLFLSLLITVYITACHSGKADTSGIVSDPTGTTALFALPASGPAHIILQMNRLAKACEKEIGPELYNSVKYKTTQLSYDSTTETKETKWWKDESMDFL